MGTGTTQTLKLGNAFLIFTERDFFLVPGREYKRMQQNEEEYVCLERKYLPVVANRDTERVICIVCHEEAAPEDLVSPLCRQMHFVLCRVCVEYLEKGTNKREVFCPFCKDKKRDRIYQKEIRAVLFSLMSRKTFLYLNMKPDMEVETVTRLTRETKVVLSNIAISDVLFFRLLSKTAVEIKNRIYLVCHENSLGRCIGELGWRTKERINICFNGYTSQEMKQVYENIKTIPRKSIQIGAKEVRAKGDGICVLLKLLDCVDGYIPDLSLESSKNKHIEEINETEINMGWIGKIGRLVLTGRAVEALSRLKLHQESMMKVFVLDAYTLGHITEILKTENNSIWVGKVKKLLLKKHAIQILPKLKFHEENEMEEFVLELGDPYDITEILKAENNSIWVGRVNRLELEDYTVEILPKLRIHGENVVEEFNLDLYCQKQITELLKMEKNGIWVGKVKRLGLIGHAVNILPKLRIHEENVMELLELWTRHPEHITEILKTENNSIWVGKVNRLSFRNCAVEILPKLRIHEESEIEREIKDFT
ncbi:MAG: uncharacterized protein A8A55_2363 [Amphiamblys sp. WSBS2006]|nr:MAG: uncharacterized protein A8A55_2363 [Amphiamblys sp. WSBS2006]